MRLLHEEVEEFVLAISENAPHPKSVPNRDGELHFFHHGKSAIESAFQSPDNGEEQEGPSSD
jgi:hypothetical protein